MSAGEIPVSWLVIEPGWDVVDVDGNHVGKVHEVIGDSGEDIFNGLAVSTGLLARPQYVPAERVAEITDGCVRLNLRSDEVEQLEAHEQPPPSEELRP